MKVFFYALFLVSIISSDVVNTAYMIFSEDHHIEFTKDFSSEKESNEKTEVDEKVYELPEFTFGLISSSNKIKILGTENSILQSKFLSSIPSPPPDHK